MADILRPSRHGDKRIGSPPVNDTGGPVYVNLGDVANPIVQAIRDGFAGIHISEPKFPPQYIVEIAEQFRQMIEEPLKKAYENALGSEILQKPFTFLIADIKQLVESMRQIVDFWQQVNPMLRVIMNSFNEWNSLQERMKASGQDLSAPNLDPVLAGQITALMSVPIVGQMVRGAVNYAHMARYQKLTGRGFASDLDQLYWLANGPASAAAGGIDQAVSKIPAFFLK